MKKIVAIITMVIMIISSSSGLIPNNNFAYASTYSDSTGELLSAMGIISKDSSGNMNLGKSLTRAEFAKMMVMASTYKTSVAKNFASSIFKDVPYSHWAAPYVKVAVANGILSGYSDGNFKPESLVTYEQGINSALKLLGYVGSDFKGGSFPYAQINMAASVGLLSGINLGIGQALTRQDGVTLITNLLNCQLKDGSKTYAEALGYKLNASGLIDYASAIASNMKGTITVQSTSWYQGLGIDATTANIYRDGSKSSLGNIAIYDIAYYSQSTNTIWAYSKKVSGIYEKALPNQDAPSSIIISGNTYSIGSAAAFGSLSSVGSLKLGSSITLLLDKDGNIGDAVSSTLTSAKTTIYVTEVGEKVFQNADDVNYTSEYIKGVNSNGTDVTYAVTDNGIYKVGDVVTIGVDEDSLTLKLESSSSYGLSGLVDANLMKIGINTLSDSVAILDTYKGAYATISPQRLDGLVLQSGSVAYYSAENGKITQFFLKNLTGDAADYGIVTSAVSNGSGMSISGKYTYLLNGVSTSISTSNSTFSISNGPAAFFISNSKLVSMRNITALSSNKITKVTTSSLYYSGKLFKYADDVSVYKNTGTGYSYSNTSEMVIAQKAGKGINYFYDSLPESGGRIRIITY